MTHADREVSGQRTSRRTMLRRLATGAGLLAALPLLEACTTPAPATPASTAAPAAAPTAAPAPKPTTAPAVVPTMAQAAAPTSAAAAAPAPAAAASDLGWLYPPLGQKQVVDTAWGPVKGNTLRLTLDGNIDALDPHKSTSNWTIQATKHICECLVTRGPDLAFQPWLAKSWEAGNGGTTWTVKLRDDVKFHDGTPLNAEAVKFNFDRIKNPDTKAGMSSGLVSNLSETSVVDASTVRFTLSKPSAIFLLNLAHPSLAMVSPTAAQKLGPDFARQPVGTGPWMFKDWKENVAITLSRFEDYHWPAPFYRHQDAAFPQEMNIGLVFEPNTRLASLKAAETHYMSITPFKFVQELRSDPRMRLWGVVLPGVANIITMNTKLAPLDDIRVRQALLHGFERKSYIDITAEGLRPVHDSVLSPATWGYNAKAGGMYPYDPARSASLLEDAGWKWARVASAPRTASR